jgi:hypothetical protein
MDFRHTIQGGIVSSLKLAVLREQGLQWVTARSFIATLHRPFCPLRPPLPWELASLSFTCLPSLQNIMLPMLRKYISVRTADTNGTVGGWIVSRILPPLT